MRYIVIGAGAIGGTIGGRLANQAARDRRAPGSATPDEVMALAALLAGAGKLRTRRAA